MKVILTEEIRGLGTRGDIVTVKDGYARNFLLPKNLAREASASNLKQIEHERRKWALLAQQEKDAAQKAADAVKGVKIRIEKRVGEHGQLFGSVTANEIADALLSRGVEVDKRRIELAQPIKNVGMHDVEVRLHRDVTAHIQVEVAAQGVERLEETETAAAAPAEAEQ
ncbi:MAG: 50S ribosomal protein L9 [Acidobacteria bacterium]|nr:50S ribosomal protein L9 [Acidobacteriota bacterium]MBV9477053.1 50S ribosomal protein L9 [Acidobacteriota bacterium]